MLFWHLRLGVTGRGVTLPKRGHLHQALCCPTALSTNYIFQQPLPMQLILPGQGAVSVLGSPCSGMSLGAGLGLLQAATIYLHSQRLGNGKKKKLQTVEVSVDTLYGHNNY